jgi:hypothetical protein
MPAATPFYNRDRERRSLRHVLRSERSELFIVYGRRGVGKSALLRDVLHDEGLPFLYYRAVRRTLPLQLAALTEAFREAFPDVFLPQPFLSTSVFLEALIHAAELRLQSGDTRPICAVIDELPYLADVDPGLITVLQHFWDDNKRRPNLKLFLAGSYLSFMERQVLDESAPLYNRRTGAMRLEPMDYAEAALFFPDYTPEEKMAAYALLGGMPSYLEQFDPAKTLRDNAIHTILRPNTYLAQEPEWLLLEDLRKDVIYGSILRAVAQGERKPSDIARAIGKDSAHDIGQQLGMLQELALLTREVPVTERRKVRSRNSLYFLADNYLDFWYRFVDGARSLVAQEMGALVWERTIEPAFHEYISRPTFERASRDYLWRALRSDALPPDLQFTEVGTWWGVRDCEIDVMALDDRGAVSAAGSCKWTGDPMDVREYQALIGDLARAGLEQAPDPFLFLFSRSGFTDRLRHIAEEQEPQRLVLVSLDQMYTVGG